jgi:hypothetical protein
MIKEKKNREKYIKINWMESSKSKTNECNKDFIRENINKKINHEINIKYMNSYQPAACNNSKRKKIRGFGSQSLFGL